MPKCANNPNIYQTTKGCVSILQVTFVSTGQKYLTKTRKENLDISAHYGKKILTSKHEVKKQEIAGRNWDSFKFLRPAPNNLIMLVRPPNPQPSRQCEKPRTKS